MCWLGEIKFELYDIKTSSTLLFMIRRNQMFLTYTHRYRNEAEMCLRQSN